MALTTIYYHSAPRGISSDAIIGELNLSQICGKPQRFLKIPRMSFVLFLRSTSLLFLVFQVF